MTRRILPGKRPAERYLDIEECLVAISSVARGRFVLLNGADGKHPVHRAYHRKFPSVDDVAEHVSRGYPIGLLLRPPGLYVVDFDVLTPSSIHAIERAVECDHCEPLLRCQTERGEHWFYRVGAGHRPPRKFLTFGASGELLGSRLNDFVRLHPGSIPTLAALAPVLESAQPRVDLPYLFTGRRPAPEPAQPQAPRTVVPGPEVPSPTGPCDWAERIDVGERHSVLFWNITRHAQCILTRRVPARGSLAEQLAEYGAAGNSRLARPKTPAEVKRMVHDIAAYWEPRRAVFCGYPSTDSEVQRARGRRSIEVRSARSAERALRIQEMRATGATHRKIAAAEGVSVSTVERALRAKSTRH